MYQKFVTIRLLYVHVYAVLNQFRPQMQQYLSPHDFTLNPTLNHCGQIEKNESKQKLIVYSIISS